MTLLTDKPLAIDALFDWLKHGTELVILCANNRISRNLSETFGQRLIGNGETIWPTPPTSTLDAWLNNIGEQISLLGTVPLEMIPDRVLTPFQECLIWKQAIEAICIDDPTLALFDLHSLARTSAEAHALINSWHLHTADSSGSEETRQFIVWRKRFREICLKNGWIDVTEYQKRVLGWLERGAGSLPAHMVFAGFDALSPHQLQLQEILKNRGVELFNLELSINGRSNLASPDNETAMPVSLSPSLPRERGRERTNRCASFTLTWRAIRSPL